MKTTPRIERARPWTCAGILLLGLALAAAAVDTDHDGFEDGVDDVPVSRAWLDFGNPAVLVGNTCTNYPLPAWLTNAVKVAGDWVTAAPTAWQVSAGEAAGVGALRIAVDMELLGADPVMELAFVNSAGSSLYVDLLDDNGTVIATNVYGNVLSGAGGDAVQEMTLPLTYYTGTTTIQLRRGTGGITVYSALLYVDQDQDRLDADQEEQLGTSDQAVDSDGDGLDDAAEVFSHETDPTLRDTDDDGMGDGAEVLLGEDPTVADSHTPLDFMDTFETLTAGVLDGQNGWTVTPAAGAVVQTGSVYAGSKAAAIVLSNASARVSHTFASDGAGTVWLDFHTTAQPTTQPTGAVAQAGALYVDTAGRLMAYDGYAAAWVALTNAPLTEGQWLRLTVKLDYAAQEWLVCLNGVTLADHIAFAATRREFCEFSAEGAVGTLDNVAVRLTVPDDVSADWDNLPDGWELNVFGNLYEGDLGDPDGDGLTNLEEWQEGLDPSLFDSDEDGMGDGTELFWGENPHNTDSFAALPFAEAFETGTVSAGDLDGQHGWTATPAGRALVQTATVYAGTQALAIGEDPADAEVRHLFAAATAPTVWIDFRTRVGAGTQPTGAVTRGAAAYFDGQGRLVVYDGLSAAWLTLTNHTPNIMGNWARLSVRLDLSAGTALYCLNGVPVAAGVGLAGTPPEFSGFTAVGQAGALDAFAVGTTQPAGVSVEWDALADTDEDGLSDWYEANIAGTAPALADSDGDGLPDGWELRYGLNPLGYDTPTADPDGDGLTHAQEAALGTNPNRADSDGDGVNDASDANPLVADQGSDIGGPTLEVTSPANGEVMLW